MTPQQAHQHALANGAKVFKRIDKDTIIAYRQAYSVLSCGGFKQWAMCAYVMIDGEYATTGEWFFCPDPDNVPCEGVSIPDGPEPTYTLTRS